MIIQKLDPRLADMIAAGEVVERPASCAKELIENAVDAGAETVTVETQRGGSGLIRVTDDGTGMNPEDAAAAFERHATSKLRTFEDLGRIGTLGFRGEALAAIASVSRVSLITRKKGSSYGCAVELEGGRLISRTESGCPEGTTIVVRDLFFNTPARQKFLKRDATESGHIAEAASRAALAHPEIAFKLIKDGREVFRTQAGSGKRACIYAIYGSEFCLGLIKAELRHEGIRVSGYVGKPEAARASRSQQLFSVNGRPVSSRTLTAALEEPYTGSIPAGKVPVCVLSIEIDPALTDINIHPAKAQIKFANERSVYDAVYFAVRQALGSDTLRPELALQGSGGALGFSLRGAASGSGAQLSLGDRPSGLASSAPVEAAFIPPEAVPVKSDYSPVSEDFGEMLAEKDHPDSPPGTSGGAGESGLPAFEPPAGLYDPATFSRPVSPGGYSAGRPPEREEPAGEGALPSWRYIGEVFGGFLLVESELCMFLIDKHAAHERIIYERLKSGGQRPMSQMLLSPLAVSLAPDECGALLSAGQFLSSIGFEIEEFGSNSVFVRSAPDVLDASDISATLSELARSLADGRKNPSVYDGLLHLVACKASVKLGRSGRPDDMLSLAKTVMETPGLRHCPHGRPVAIRLTRSQLERQFGR